MGDGGHRGEQQGSGERGSCAQYTWEEVQKHNLTGDQWLVIERKVYNVSEWTKRHPGGSRVLEHYIGEDATDAFTAFHPDRRFVRKFMKPLLLGELAPSEPSQDHDKNAALVKDFQALRKQLEEQGLFRTRPLFYILYIGHILLLEALPLVLLWQFGNGWIVTILSAVMLATAQAQAGWLQHDLGHLSVFKNSTWDHLAHKFVIGHLKGASANWWNYQHFQHHSKPNVLSKDPDLNTMEILVLGNIQPVEYGIKKLKHMPYNHQHKYFFLIGPPLLIPVFFSVHIFRTLCVRRHWVLKSTCNVEQSLFNDWFTGHLNFQIEHHVFPTMPRHNYVHVAPRLRELCEKYGVQYQVKGLLEAMSDIIGSLKKSGELWLDAYLHK
ncbi:acyl-CoA Delta-4 desaturase-like isoform X2 [Tachysurus fulvidraco]|uniref:acyl-CoA Delta-4 desaturase-like isoform X2 n=1 Tax=Tachysurus fulvidraco TaxID=1234273 RepID=UPI001FEE6B80|nr:acyl-CoA Delta-4 desaturase-like isoform X2 [Tachysurus fulvidraco]